MEKSKQVKKLESNIKSGYGTFVVFPILTLMYVVRCFIAGDLNYYFSSFFSEFLLKYTGYFEGYKEGLSLPLALILIVAYNAIFALCFVLSAKNFKWTYFGFAVIMFDFILEIFCISTNYFEPFHVDMLVDVIVHAFIVFFLIVGMVSYSKLEKIKNEKAHCVRQ